MNTRERFLAVMGFQPQARTLLWEWGYWGGTIERWYTEGLPRRHGLRHPAAYGDTVAGPGAAWGSGVLNVQQAEDVPEALGFDLPREAILLENLIYPPFAEEVLEEGEEHVTVRDAMSAICKQRKDGASKPRSSSGRCATELTGRNCGQSACDWTCRPACRPTGRSRCKLAGGETLPWPSGAATAASLGRSWARSGSSIPITMIPAPGGTARATGCGSRAIAGTPTSACRWRPLRPSSCRTFGGIRPGKRWRRATAAATTLRWWTLDGIRGRKPVPIGIHEAMGMTLPGLVSQESIRCGGAWLPVPDSREWWAAGGKHMKGSEIAWRTLNQEDVAEPCILASWLMKGDYYSRATGRDYWADREAVYLEALPGMGVNLCPQFCPPVDRRGMAGHYDEGSLNRAGIHTPEEIIPLIEALPSDEELERAYDVDAAAGEYGQQLLGWRAATGDAVLFISHFGQPDFMGPLNDWGYTNYLMAIGLYPEHVERYYRYTATRGCLLNRAIVEAVRKYDLAPYVYGGQDICTNVGPMCSVGTLEAIFFPHLERAIQPLIEAGIRIIWHCDGDIRPILEPLLGRGISGLQGFQEETGLSYADMVKVHDRWGRPLIIWGCVSVTTTFHVSTEAVKEAVRRSFCLAGRGRGFGLASTSSIMPDVPDEHIDAFYQYGREFGRAYLSGRGE